MLSEEPVVSKNKVIGIISVFSALIAISTILVIPLPQPLGEFTWSPPIYMALSVLAGPWPAFFATALGSFVGESTNVAIRGFPPIYALGIVWARAPEALFIGWARKKDRTTLVVVMGLATVYETIAFLLPDWVFYTYGLFGYGSPVNVGTGFVTALPDILTIFDVVYVPVAFAIIKAASPAFKKLGFR
ncbi:MAG: hypothetical protein E6K96_09320 [Thaumarchaeota archaeon]|nr:MAG: hypothetical protein E6K96_09320 [Nitrososphaerota archaeon]